MADASKAPAVVTLTLSEREALVVLSILDDLEADGRDEEMPYGHWGDGGERFEGYDDAVADVHLALRKLYDPF